MVVIKLLCFRWMSRFIKLKMKGFLGLHGILEELKSHDSDMAHCLLKQLTYVKKLGANLK